MQKTLQQLMPDPNDPLQEVVPDEIIEPDLDYSIHHAALYDDAGILVRSGVIERSDLNQYTLEERLQKTAADANTAQKTKSDKPLDTVSPSEQAIAHDTKLSIIY